MKLKEYIKANKPSFEDKKMSNDSDVTFENLLKEKLHQPKKQKIVYLKYTSVAACFILVISTFFWFQNYADKQEQKKELLASLDDDSAGKRLEGVYKFNDDYAKEDSKIIDKLINILNEDTNANVKIASIDALLKFPSNEKIRKSFIEVLGKEETPLVQIKLIKAVSFLRENRAQKLLEKLINNERTYPIVKNNATLAMVEIKQ
jgi:hypothetical protein